MSSTRKEAQSEERHDALGELGIAQIARMLRWAGELG